MVQRLAVKHWDIAHASAYGGILLRPEREILLREPSNHFDGYVWTFAKGRPQVGDTPAQTALREVFEETGYRAEIIGVLPGQFAGGTTTNAYFVMRPLGVPGKPDWETRAIRWVSLDHAAALIEGTHNLKGRQRDIEVLHATAEWLASHRDRVVADEGAVGLVTAGDWLSHPLPKQHCTVALNFRLDSEDSAAIRKGFLPREQEEKWFAYFTDLTLFQHRSWTGNCIYQVHFVDQGNGLHAAHAEVNRDPEQYGETDDAVDIERIGSLVRSLAEHNRVSR